MNYRGRIGYLLGTLWGRKDVCVDEARERERFCSQRIQQINLLDLAE